MAKNEEVARRVSNASSSDISLAPDKSPTFPTAFSSTATKKKDSAGSITKSKKPQSGTKGVAAMVKKEKEGAATNISPSPAPSSPAVGFKGDEKPVCKHCKKQIDQAQYESHLVACLNHKKEAARRKKERKEARRKEAEAKAKEAEEAENAEKEGSAGLQDKDDGDASGKAKGATVDDGDGKKSKKRKATDEASAAPNAGNKSTAVPPSSSINNEPKKKKLKKDEPPKAKATKPRGPVNVEIQCGVPLDPIKGGYCARSLTCKSHPMGLKRAVPGRSLPYDQLLAMYQKKNQAKQQKALIEAQVSVMNEDDAEHGAVDSEEERENVMKGLAGWRPRPAEQTICIPVRRRYQYIRLKEMLGNALSGSGGGLGRNMFAIAAKESRRDTITSMEPMTPALNNGGGFDQGNLHSEAATTVAAEEDEPGGDDGGGGNGLMTGIKVQKDGSVSTAA